MKKTPSFVLAICFASFLMFGCGGKKEETKTDESGMSTEKSKESNAGSESKTEESGDNKASAGSNSKCDQFLADYEAFVNEYIELANKVKENPQDMSVMTEYSQMAAKSTKWASDAKECSSDAAFAAKYAQLYARIAAKASGR
jgi:hypothetical protein